MIGLRSAFREEEFDLDERAEEEEESEIEGL